MTTCPNSGSFADRLSRRLRLTLLVVPAVVAVTGGLASALEARSLLVAGAVLIGWSQLVGL